GRPILERLIAKYAEVGAESQLRGLLDGWRGQPSRDQGYGPGNVVNLLRLLCGNLRGRDLSRLTLRQVFLQGIDAQDASLADAHLDGALLDEAFSYPTSVAISTDGSLLAAGTPGGEVRLWRQADRTPLLAVQGHSAGVWGLSFSRDRRVLAS